MTKSIYDIKLDSWDGSSQDLLANLKGKVTLIINVTTDCGNAPQFGIIQDLYEKYQDQGFEVIAIPTNEYCGGGITYGKWKDGIESAEEAYTYAKGNYGATYKFTELVNSKPGEGWFKQLPEGEKPHEIFATLSEITNTDMFGNFEKYLIDRNGEVVGRYANGALLDYAMINSEGGIKSSGEELARIERDIQLALDGQPTEYSGGIEIFEEVNA